MINNLASRIVLDAILFLCILQGWWLVAFIIAIIHALAYRYPFELLIAGLVYDSLFGLLPGTGIAGYAGTIAMICAIAIIAAVKKHVRQ